MSEPDPRQSAVCLLSGGLDSATALAWAVRRKGWRCHTIAFDYGQRHRVELTQAARVAEALGAASHRVVAVDLRAIGGSALTADIPVPKEAREERGIPITYVPARNLIFLSIAAGLAETVEAEWLIIGANVIDYSGYPDCRPEFLDAFAAAVNLATRAGTTGRRLRIAAPLIRCSKGEIIRMGLELGVDYGLTRSCYDPDPEGRPCGRCDSCRYRARGFAEAGVADPLLERR
ncbi:MAG: 7-cyano-7-deazaguanine synthase QueC [Zetaproteobacteria bacterium]|nr:MAG: 7-cyano-7-deazaguanine synthase QueC [Zetaproteobacteria bacterium]